MREEKGVLREATIYLVLIGMMASFIAAEIFDYKNEARFFDIYTADSEHLNVFLDYWEDYHLINSEYDLPDGYECETIFVREKDSEDDD